MSETAILFSLVLAFAAAGYVFVVRRERRVIADRFAGREHLTLDQVCDLFCGDGGLDRELVKELIQHAASELSTSPEVLRPTDRFDVELKPAPGSDFDSARNTLLLDLNRLSKEKGRHVDLATVRTLGEYVRAMSSVY